MTYNEFIEKKVCDLTEEQMKAYENGEQIEVFLDEN